MAAAATMACVHGSADRACARVGRAAGQALRSGRRAWPRRYRARPQAGPGAGISAGLDRQPHLGRNSDAPARYVVTADTLNIRRGPDASFEPVAAPLKQGAIVLLLQPGDRWSKVEVEGPTDIEGWVNNSFIVRALAAPRQRAASRRAARAAPRRRQLERTQRRRMRRRRRRPPRARTPTKKTTSARKRLARRLRR